MNADQNTQQVSHTMTIPPATDIEALCSFIGQLMNAREITNNLTIKENLLLDHPIPESKEQLTREAITLNQVLAGWKMQWTTVILLDARFTGNSVFLVFQCSGDRTNEFLSFG